MKRHLECPNNLQNEKKAISELSDSLCNICFVENGPDSIIIFCNRPLSSSNRCERAVMQLLFDSTALSLAHWLPFLWITEHDQQPLRLSEKEVKEFRELFGKIRIEMGTAYVYRNEYVLDLLKLIILLIGKIFSTK